MELITLKARKRAITRTQKITEIFNQDGTIKAVFPSLISQPRKGQKTIVINCFKYALEWE